MATTRNARSPNFIDVNQAVNGGGSFVGPLTNGDIVRVPAGPALWGPTDVLAVTADISIIGAGMDPTQAIPSDSVATNITCQNSQFITCNFTGSQSPVRISGFSLELTVAANKYLFTLAGKCYRRRVSGNVVGGLRVDNIRVRNTANPAVTPLLFQWGGPPAGSGAGTFITGSFDHNFIDFPNSDSNELSTFACSGSPNGSSPDGWGQWQCCQYYLHGGGDDSELNVVYIEDNIFHKKGFVLGTLQGGGRIVVRHNTAWGPIAGHGIDSGGNQGTTSWECYNNFFDLKGKANTTCFNTRGGTQVLFNNRATNVAGSSKMIATGTYRPTSTTSAMIGPASGRNFLDENQRGAFSVNGASFSPVVADNADIRIGSVYAKGLNPTVNTAGKDYTLSGIDGTKGNNAWVGFVINNTDSLGAEDLGDQGVQTGDQGLGYGFIIGSTDVNATTVRVTVAPGGNGIFNLTNSQHWEIRKVKSYFCGPGAGKIPFLTNGGMNKNKLPNTGIADTTGYAYQTSKANADGQGHAKFKYWSAQYAFGIWQKYNLSRVNSGTDWDSATPVTIASNSALAKTYPGGLNDDLPAHSGNDGSGGAYPMYAGAAATLRVGADWNAPGYTEGISQGEHGCPTLAGGAAYPNAMVSAVVTPRIVSPASITFTQGVGGSFQVQVADFSVAPTFSKSGSFPASGSTFSSGGLLTVGVGSAAGVYAFTITATHLTEVATQNFTLTITASATRIIALSGSLAFGGVDINTTSQKNLTISNSGNATLTVTSISLPSGFTANWMAGDIVAGGNQLVIVTFSPVAGTSYGGNITVTSNSTSGTNTIAASGLGVTRIIALSGSLAFGSITVGQTATRQLTITNSGNSDLTLSAITYPEGFSGDFSLGSTPPSATIPRGNFALTKFSVETQLLTDPDIDGISLFQEWFDFETSDGVYSWTYFDAQIQKCVNANKPCTIRVIMGGDDVSTTTTGGNKPHWFYTKFTAAGGTYVTIDDNGTSKTIPVFWDPLIIAQKNNISAAICSRYNTAAWQLADGTPCLKHVQISVCDQNSDDWAVDDSPTGTAQWLAAGWTDQKIIDTAIAIASVIPLTQTFGFPFNPAGWNIDNPTNSTSHHQLEQKVIDALRNAHGNHFVAQKNNMNALQGTSFPAGTNFDVLYNNPPCAAQDVWFVSGDGTFRYNGGTSDNIHTIYGKGSDSLRAINAQFIESYRPDCLFDWTSVANADTTTPGRDEIKYRHDKVLEVASVIVQPPSGTGSLVLVPGASKLVNITFSPLAAQVYGGPVAISSNKTSGTSSISASGTGVSTATKVIQLTGDLNFGGVQTGTTATRTLTITNSGNANLSVTSITYPTGFTGAFTGTVAAGASHDVTVTFSPVSAINYSGTVTVASDATSGTNTTMASGNGVTPATMVIGLSGNLAFGNVQIATTPTRTLTIANSGSAPLTVSGITYPSGFSGSYSGTIAPGASHDVTVTFSPTQVQSYGGTVTVASDATAGTSTTSASGNGVVAATKVIALSGNLAFGNVQKNHSIQRIMTIMNNGTDTLSVTNITCPTAFSVNLTTATIAPGTSQNVTVTFKPTAQQSYGGDITVVSDKTSGVNTIACSGNGTNKKQVPFILIVS